MTGILIADAFAIGRVNARIVTGIFDDRDIVFGSSLDGNHRPAATAGAAFDKVLGYIERRRGQAGCNGEGNGKDGCGTVEIVVQFSRFIVHAAGECGRVVVAEDAHHHEGGEAARFGQGGGEGGCVGHGCCFRVCEFYDPLWLVAEFYEHSVLHAVSCWLPWIEDR